MRSKKNQLASILLVMAVLFCSCNKEENGDIRQAKVTTLKASVSATTPATKTQHEFSDNTLKVRWSKGDEIAVSDGKELYKFSQTGEISDDGHSALFSSESTVSFEEGEIIAVYPCTTDLTYDLTNQTGKVDKLFQTDLLLARAKVTTTAVEDLAFMPLCAVIRFPKDTLVTDEDFTGEMKMTISGENVGGKIIISKTGGINVQKTDVSVTASISNGRFSEDTYVVFVPKVKTGTYSYILSTDRFEEYPFVIEDITTTSIYNARSIFKRVVVFDDDVFKNYCLENFDLDRNGEISFKEADQIKCINVSTNNISSLKGIDKFRHLTELYCYGNVYRGKLTQLSLKGCKQLKILDCQFNNLENLDVSGCPLLESLNCHWNYLKSINLANNPKLAELQLWGNNFETIDVGNNLDLRVLRCDQNKLKTIDVSNNKKLESLSCGENQISSIDISNNQALTYFHCYPNKLTCLDVSKNVVLKKLVCSCNQLSSLDLSQNVELETLSCFENQLNALDLSKNSKLLTLNCNNNKLTNIDISFCTVLSELECAGNLLTQLLVTNNKDLTSIDCSNNQITSLNCSSNSELVSLRCGANPLKTIDVTKNTKLCTLGCGGTKITELDVSNNSSLVSLAISGTKIPKLDVSNKHLLQWLYCSNCDLTELKINDCSSLTQIECNNNHLTSLNLAGCSSILYLDCHDNAIESLTYHSTTMNSLSCYNNKLSLLDVSSVLGNKRLYAWPQDGVLSVVKIKRWTDFQTKYYFFDGTNYLIINPSDYGTTIIEVD